MLRVAAKFAPGKAEGFFRDGAVRHPARTRQAPILVYNILNWEIKFNIDQPTECWVGTFAKDCDTLRPQLVDRLVARRIVLRDRYDRLLAMGGYNGAAVNGRPMRDVKRRIAGELLNDEIPDPRDVMIVSLADICGMWPALIGESAFDRLKPKIRQIAKMDLIGQAVAHVVNGH